VIYFASYLRKSNHLL